MIKKFTLVLNNKMKDSGSIFQLTLFKIIIVIYFIFIILNSIFSNDSFFHDNAQFGIWAMISFIMLSIFILTIDFIIISISNKIYKKNIRIYILLIQLMISIAVCMSL